MWVTRDLTMVASHLLLLNHLLMALAHNSPAGPSHPNAIGGIYTTKGEAVVRPVMSSMVSYEVVGGDGPQPNRLFSSCSVGCASCSPVNGCLACRPPFLLTLRREGARQIPSCLPNCPPGFFKTRVDQYRVCASCSLPGCRVCRRSRRCSLCDEGYLKDSKSGHCIKIIEGMETSMHGSDPAETRIEAPHRNRSSRRRIRKRRRKKGRKFTAGRRRRLRGRRQRKLRGRGSDRKKLKKQRRPNPAENEVAIDAEIMPPFSLKGSTSLNLGRIRPRKPNNRRRGRKRRGRRRRNRVSTRAEKGFGEEQVGSSEMFVSRETSRSSIIAWHRDRPQVSLARPSRHIHLGQHNATHTIQDNTTRVIHTVDSPTRHSRTINDNRTRHTHTKRSDDTPSSNSGTDRPEDMGVRIFSGRGVGTGPTRQTRGTRTNFDNGRERPESHFMNLLGRQSLEGASSFNSGRNTFKFDSGKAYINGTEVRTGVDTRQLGESANVREIRRRRILKGAQKRRRHRRRPGLTT